jgi:PAS domain S-box-containing protein
MPSILLIDDDEEEFLLMRNMFSPLPGQGDRERYYLEWEPDPELALKKCASSDYDIFLVDYHLGVVNGLDLIRRADALGSPGPFILLTGQGSFELDWAAMQQGVADYLVKNQLNEYTLERALRYALERKNSRNELETRVRERTRELDEKNRALVQEIDRRIHAETTLRRSEERFRMLAETTSAAIFIVQDGVIRYANQTSQLITGYSAEELVGESLNFFVHPDDQQFVSRLIQGNATAQRFTVEIIDRVRGERRFEFRMGEMEFEGRSAYSFTAFDITERDLAEQVLRNAKDELERRVVERTAEIQAARIRLETVLGSLPVSLMIADAAGNIV